MIEIRVKLWISKVLSRYTFPTYGTDIDDSVFGFTNYRNCLFKPSTPRGENVNRNNYINFKESLHNTELDKDFKIEKTWMR